MDQANTAGQAGSIEPKHWGLLGTILWGLAIAVVFLVLQVVASLAVVLRGKTNLTDQEVLALIESAQGNGIALSISTLVTSLACVPLVLGVIKLRRGSVIREYLALRAVPRKTLARWLGLLVISIGLSDGLTFFLGRRIVPEFVTTVYASTRPVWLIWLALVIAAPIFEETFFRGFLFKGFGSSFIGPIGATALTALLWATIHAQYDIHGMMTVFFLGLVLGAARMLTGSLLVPLAMHATANIVAGLEAALLV